MTFLGIDLGTSEVKGLLTDSRSVPLATGAATLSISRPHPHWSEQSPQAWWHAMLVAFASVRAAHPAGLAALRGFALSVQMHGATLIDRADQVLRPA
ncbi:xylulokinase, partial [Burkholderia cenocepacia]|uniref:FGGY family carbohydrate kinase n=1 Tax=Burkholderia cenocepacia TaxID=95486 RepID=UPI002861FF2A